MRRRYLVAYDIRDQRRLRRVHEVMLGWGYPVQYSVFVCDLTRGERYRMKEELENEMNLVSDSVIVVDLGEVERFDEDCVEFLGARPDFGRSGPVIL